MKCPGCGHEVAEGSKFCINCGRELQASPVGEAAPWYRDKKRLIVAVTALAAVACILALVALLRGGTDAEAKIMASMREANGGVDPELSYDGDELVSIEGRFSSVRVAGRADALSAFGEVAPLFGIYRPTEELEFDREEEGPRPGATTYVFAVAPAGGEDDARGGEGGADAPAGRREIAVTADGSGDVSRVERRRAEKPVEGQEDVELSAQAETVSLLLPTRFEAEAFYGTDEFVASYDENGRMVRKECRPSSGIERKDDSITSLLYLYYATYEYRYDGLGRLEGVDITDSVAFGGAYDGTWDIRYSDDGSSMEAELRRAGGDGVDGRIRESYDGAGNLLRREYQMPYGLSVKETPILLGATESYQYSADGQLEEVTIECDEDTVGSLRDAKGEASKISYSFSYAATGQMMTITEDDYLPSGELLYEYVHDLDEHGNVINRTYKNQAADSRLIEHFAYSEEGIPKAYSTESEFELDDASIEQQSDTSYRFSELDLGGAVEYKGIECRTDRAPLVLLDTSDPIQPVLATDLWVGCITPWGLGKHVLPQVLMNYKLSLLVDDDQQQLEHKATDGNDDDVEDVTAIYEEILDGVKAQAQESSFFHQLNYQFVDIDADGIEELFCSYLSGAHSQTMNRIYKVQNGKAVCVFEYEYRGCGFSYCYPQASTIVFDMGYKGMLHTWHYQYQDGAFVQRAAYFDNRGYNNGSLSYQGAEGLEIAESEYQQIVSELESGEGIRLSLESAW